MRGCEGARVRGYVGVSGIPTQVDVADLGVHLGDQGHALVARCVGRPVAGGPDLGLEVGRHKRRAEEVLGVVLVTLAAARARLRAGAAVADRDALERGAGVGVVAHREKDRLGQSRNVDPGICGMRGPAAAVSGTEVGSNADSYTVFRYNSITT